MARKVLTATIPAGQSLSNAVDLSAGTIVFFHMPAQWTPAVISFLVSPDNVTFGDLVETNGRELSFNVYPSTVIRPDKVPPKVGWLKLRSGSRYGAVVQSAARIITITEDDSPTII